MDDSQRAFLDDLLATASPSGFETTAQRVWIDYVSEFADEVQTDEYGNAVAVYEGGEGEGPELLFGGHADEIGFMVASVDDDGFVRLTPIGGADRTVSKGQHVVVHTDDGPVNGVVGQTAIHLRGAKDEDEPENITEQHVDIGAADEEEAEELVEVGDPITVATDVHDLQGTRVAARGIDNRVGIWVAAEALRRAVERDAESTVYAVSTVQEEVGLKGARMVGYDVHPDAAVAVDVTHASDHPAYPSDLHAEIELGEGPVVARGSTNHPELVAATRDAADAEELDVQLQATGVYTGTDADAFYVQRDGIPSLNLALPNRYMHTPAEVVDTDDLDAAADLLAALAVREAGREGFAVDL
ncbi:M20/M25/M40 family metallo-hydrolase [Halospeciosus flavus]|uniref:M20/M25/M40 family metallo-hydrolase n=1 Tax=Halospeciosus flavus TaxID=3032283 RepID=A0ABD5Z1F9_9EURY|nr:M20/M25/M40 family metallo-hydrolase [Halospeciosus flavus]